MMTLRKGPGGGCLRGRPLYDGSQPSKYAGAGGTSLDVSPSRDSHLAFFDLAGGHGLRVDGLHDVAAHALEALPSEALISQLTAIKAAVEHSLRQRRGLVWVHSWNEVERRVGLDLIGKPEVPMRELG